ncbi:hypothetical protein GCE9029_01181 [Grimontia celer]|uniref:Uncharacterized protein n=1 Tax=Grimontia celer TaxID=1796497 RepID=A0A128EXN4_9GAMM|nr:hypothetical protein [Grimontia celer]CZF78985.1 hypothetical protein GCE9029_01181 [Grimontia celer]
MKHFNRIKYEKAPKPPLENIDELDPEMLVSKLAQVLECNQAYKDLLDHAHSVIDTQAEYIENRDQQLKDALELNAINDQRLMNYETLISGKQWDALYFVLKGR